MYLGEREIKDAITKLPFVTTFSVLWNSMAS
jgi:hypothetical protein